MPAWTYIFEHPGANPDEDRMVIERSGFRSIIIAVNSVADAPALVRTLVAEENVGMVELCGSFTTEDAQRVVDVVGPGVAVGHTTFSREAIPGLNTFVASFESTS